MDRRRPGTLLAVVLLLTVSTGVAVQQPEDGRALPGKDWPLVGGDWTSARYSTLDQINTTNVKTLGGAWNKRIAGSTRATPVVKNGLLVLPTGESVVAFPSPQRFDLAAALLRIEAFLAGALFGFGGPPGLRTLGRQLHQCDEARARRHSIGRLGAMLAAVDRQHAFGGCPVPGERQQALFHVGRERGGAHVEFQFDRG